MATGDRHLHHPLTPAFAGLQIRVDGTNGGGGGASNNDESRRNVAFGQQSPVGNGSEQVAAKLNNLNLNDDQPIALTLLVPTCKSRSNSSSNNNNNNNNISSDLRSTGSRCSGRTLNASSEQRASFQILNQITTVRSGEGGSRSSSRPDAPPLKMLVAAAQETQSPEVDQTSGEQPARGDKPLIGEHSPAAPTYHQLDISTTNNSSTYSNAHYSTQQQQHHQRHMISTDFNSSHSAAGVGMSGSGLYATTGLGGRTNGYSIDFVDAVYPTFASDQTPSSSSHQYRVSSLAHEDRSPRLVSMDAEFADLTYSSSGHFLSLDPVPTSSGVDPRNFKVQELSAFELSLNSTGTNLHNHHHHQQQQHHHQNTSQGYESSPGNFASLYPAAALNNHCVDAGPDSVIRLSGFPRARHSDQYTGGDGNSGDSAEVIQLIHEQHDSGNVSGSLSCLDSGAGSSMLSQSQQFSHQHQLQNNHYTNSNYQPPVTEHNQLLPQQHQQQNLQQHQHQHYNSSANLQDLDQGLKVCEWDGCEHTFLDMQEFVKHLEDRHVNQEPKEKGRYFCLWSNCKRNDQEFNARYKLLIHMRVHSGEKPYPCNNINCKKSFSRLENLKIHQRSHTGEKPYKCNFEACSKSFTNSSDRIKHHKTHKDPKPYSCNFADCTKRYTDPSSLRKHLRTHKRPQLPIGNAQPVPLLQVDRSQLVGSSSGEHSLTATAQRLPTGCCADFDPTLLLEPSSTTRQSSSHLNTEHNQQQHQQPMSSADQDFHSQHWQLSRSWCAGSKPSATTQHNHTSTSASLRPLGSLAADCLDRFSTDISGDASPLSGQQQNGSFVPGGSLGLSFNSSLDQRLLAPNLPAYQQGQQHQYNQHQHQRLHQPHELIAHETLMRSMPSQGLRASQQRHASTDWLGPPAQRNEFRRPYAQHRTDSHSLWQASEQSNADVNASSER